MGLIKLLAAPVRSIVRFPLFQLAVVVAVILFLQAGDDNSARGQIFDGLDRLVESTVGLFSAVLNLKSFTKSWLNTGFWIAYVYLGCLLILFLFRVVISKMVDFAGWRNLFGLRNAIARRQHGPAVPSASATDSERCDELCSGSPGRCPTATNFYSFSGPDLAWPGAKNVGQLINACHQLHLVSSLTSVTGRALSPKNKMRVLGFEIANVSNGGSCPVEL